MNTRFVSILAVAVVATFSHAGTIDWTATSETHAFGTLDGVGISAVSPFTAPFIGVANQRFAADGAWDAAFALPRSATALVTSKVNGGDFQEFAFDEPLSEGLFYIENFDSDSVARITAKGADVFELTSGSPSISFSSLSDEIGTLRTSNSSYNGEGDAVLFFEGEVTGIRVEYFNGQGDNGIFYGFATQTVQALPEPAASSMVQLLALLPLMLRRSRRHF